MLLTKPHIKKLAIAALAVIMLPMAESCHSDNKDVVVAEAYGHLLYSSDLQEITKNMSPEDSATVADNYINQWIQQTVVLEQANISIKNSFEKELEAYRNSLLIYEYEQQVIKERLDTTVSEKELSEYYFANEENFTLQTSIVKCMYVKFPKDAQVISGVKKLMEKRKLSDEEMDAIQKDAAIYAQDYNFDVDTWMPFYKLQAQVPITTYNEELFLKNNSTIEISDSSSTWLVKFLEYRLAKEVSPLSFEREHIKSIILNSLRIDIIKDMQMELLRDAEKENMIKKYKIRQI